MDKPLVFLSHAGEDTQSARDLAVHLKRAELEVWLDVEKLKPGDRWGKKIEEGLSQAKTFVLYVGKSGVRNWVDQEVRVALDRSTKEKDFRLIPVLGPGADPDALPLFLKQYQWLDLRNGLTEAAQLKKLVEGATQGPAEGVSLLPEGKSPFRGLQAFDVEDSLLFFGRDAEVRELLDKLKADSFLAVVGDSGSGKSSLVRAGLIPALHRGRFHDGKGWVESWRIAITRPGEDPFGELAEALPELKPGMSEAARKDFLGGSQKEGHARDSEKDSGLRKDLCQNSQALRNAIAALVPRGCHTLLVVDQFEELFTMARKPDPGQKERPVWGHYVDALLAAARSEGERPVHVLVTLRADFYQPCFDHALLIKRMGANLYNVPRASSERLREVIEKPLARAGANAEPGLVDGILNDVGDEPGNLPLLEHALSQLWERRKGNEITHEAYTEIGRLSGALKNHANDVLKGLSPQNQELARKIFLNLTQLGEGSEDTRRRVKKADLLRLGGDGEAEKVLKALTDARLVTSGGEGARASGLPTEAETEQSKEMVEVSHEALIREWPTLQGWLNHGRDQLRIERRLFQAAEEWDKANPKRDPSLLWSGTKLMEGKAWADRHDKELPSQVREFLTASKNARRTGFLQRAALWVLVGLLFLVPAGYGLRYWLRIQSERREAIYVDPATRLMWTKSDNKYDVTWPEAETYCHNLHLGGYSGWKLAEFEELKKLYDHNRAGIRDPFEVKGWVWSSTKEPFNEHEAWIFGFESGIYGHYKVGAYYRALCVRGPGE